LILLHILIIKYKLHWNILKENKKLFYLKMMKNKIYCLNYPKSKLKLFIVVWQNKQYSFLLLSYKYNNSNTWTNTIIYKILEFSYYATYKYIQFSTHFNRYVVL